MPLSNKNISTYCGDDQIILQCNLLSNRIIWSAPGLLNNDIVVGLTNANRTEYSSIKGIISIRFMDKQYYNSSFLTFQWDDNRVYENLSLTTFGCMPDDEAIYNQYNVTIDLTCKLIIHICYSIHFI